MKYILRGAGTAVFLLAVILGCQTAPTALVTPAVSTIQVESSGLSPNDAIGPNKTIDISVLFGNPEAVKTWKIEALSAGMVRRTWTSDASYLPASFSWDGTNDNGTMAPEGTYTLKLSVDYVATYTSATAGSRNFILDITPPTGSIAMDPPRFTPRANGVSGPVTFTINARSELARMDSWSLDVYDASGGLVNHWGGEWPKSSVVWDGSSMGGGVLTPDAEYRVVATVRDEYGNSSLLKNDIAVASLPAPVTPVPEPRNPSIVALNAGFSPNGDNVVDTMTLALRYGQRAAVSSWTVTVSRFGEGARKTWNGDGSLLPSRLVWDGKTASGDMAPEGTYTATFNVNYGIAFTAGTATSSSFVLDLTPPTGTISLSSELFSPIESSNTITLKLDASSKLGKVDSWTMDIYDSGWKSIPQLLRQMAREHGCLGRQEHQRGNGRVSGGLHRYCGSARPVRQHGFRTGDRAHRHPCRENDDGVSDPRLPNILQGIHRGLYECHQRACHAERAAAQ